MNNPNFNNQSPDQPGRTATNPAAAGNIDPALAPQAPVPPNDPNAEPTSQPTPPQPDARAIAADQMIHSMLLLRRDHSGAETARRLERFAAALRATGGPDPSAPVEPPALTLARSAGDAVATSPGRRPATRRRFAWRFATAAAACLALGFTFLAVLPRESSAIAMVDASLAASKASGDRRYEIRELRGRREGLPPEPRMILDVRDDDHVVMRINTPRGEKITVGRDDVGAWVVRPDGSIDHYPPEEAWPRWINFGQETMLLESVDELMKGLADDYDLQKSDAAPLPGDKDRGGAFERITATHKLKDSPRPQRVELWISPNTRIAHRIEIHWPDRGPAGSDGPPRPEGRDRLERLDRPDGPAPHDLDRGPRDRPPPKGPRPHPGPRPEMHPDAGRPDGPPPPSRPDPGFAPDGGPRPDDRGGPDGMPPPPRGPRPPLPGGPGGPDGPGGPGGPRRPGMGPGPGEPAGPEFMRVPPNFRGGRHPPPPRMLVIELIEGTDRFPDNWFSPSTHAAAGAQPADAPAPRKGP